MLFRSCGANGWLWSITCWAPRPLTQSRVWGREVVAMTVRLVNLRASWMAIEPTPPAPPTTNSERFSPPSPRLTPMRSNSSSQAVMVVSGRAAACAKPTDLGLRPTMRSSTNWKVELLPGRLMLPA